MAAAARKLSKFNSNSNALPSEGSSHGFGTSCGTTKRQVDFVTSSTLLELPPVDTDHLLKSRLYFHAPVQTVSNPAALYFKRPTQTQMKKSAIPAEAMLEPLVCFDFTLSWARDFVKQGTCIGHLRTVSNFGGQTLTWLVRPPSDWQINYSFLQTGDCRTFGSMLVTRFQGRSQVRASVADLD